MAVCAAQVVPSIGGESYPRCAQCNYEATRTILLFTHAFEHCFVLATLPSIRGDILDEEISFHDSTPSLDEDPGAREACDEVVFAYAAGEASLPPTNVPSRPRSRYEVSTTWTVMAFARPPGLAQAGRAYTAPAPSVYLRTLHRD